MEYRELGRTRLRVSEIGFGCGNVGGLMIRGSHDEQVQAIRKALELGINYFDTAQQRSLRESLSRLRRKSVDVFQLHSQITLKRGGSNQRTLEVEDVLGVGGVADAFDEAKSKGLIRYCGFTGLGETEALHQIIDSGRFDLVQAYYNLLNPSAGLLAPTGFVGHDFRFLIRKASEKKMGVVVIRVLAGGALGGEAARQGYASPSPGPLIRGTDYEADLDRAEKLHFLVGGEIPSLAQAGIMFALMNRAVSIALVGFSNLGQIEEAANCSGRAPFPENFMERLRGLWATDFRRK
jgi:aryl-alcohol dehydrogenase-like predicted oxidoreductase